MESMELLKNFLSKFFAVPPLEWLHFVNLLKKKNLGKGEFFFKQGEAVSELGFVMKGLLYNSYTNEKGEDFVKYFISEGHIAGCYSSLLQGLPAAFSSQALEDVTIFTLDYEKLQNLYKRHVCWEKIGRLNAEKLYIEKEHREQRFMMCDAKTRYELFVKEHPDLLQRVPQYLVASYIGISPVSLSRIRADR